MHFFDLQCDFLIPLWRRVAVVMLCLGWGFFEFASGAPFWGVIFIAAGAYACWQLFLDGWPDKHTGERPD